MSVFAIHEGAERYYLEATRSGSARTAGLFEAEGHWLGSSAGELGLIDQPVGAVSLRALFAGVHPLEGEILHAHRRTVRNVALDCMFAAPKSVSLLCCLGDPALAQATRGAHERAVVAALGYLEHECAFVRRGRAANVHAAAGLTAAAFLHRSSRAPDPHLHTHVLVANLARGLEDGRWTALDARSLFAMGSAAGALYDAQLRHELSRELGVDWRRRGSTYDVAGVPDRVLRAFSRRSEELERARISSDDAAHVERPRRDLATSYEELTQSWSARADALGLPARHLRRLVERCAPLVETDEGDLHGAVERAISAFETPFLASQLLVRTARSLEHGAPVAALEDAVSAALVSGAARAIGRRIWLSGRKRTLPIGLPHRAYCSAEVVELGAALQARLAAAPTLEPGLLEPGLYALDLRARSAREARTVLTCLRDEVLAASRSLVVLAADAASAEAFETSTGLGAAVVVRPSIEARATVVLLVDVERFGVRRLEAVLERAERAEVTVVRLTLPYGLVRDDEPAPLSFGPRPLVRAERERVRTARLGRSA